MSYVIIEQFCSLQIFTFAFGIAETKIFNFGSGSVSTFFLFLAPAPFPYITTLKFKLYFNSTCIVTKEIRLNGGRNEAFIHPGSLQSDLSTVVHIC